MVKKIFFSVLVFYFTLEVSLRITGKLKSPNEISTGEYYCQYRQKIPTWYHYYKPNYTHLYKQIEFEYTNTYNELGSREKPFVEFTLELLYFAAVFRFNVAIDIL